MTIWGGGSNGDGTGAIGNHVKDLLSTVAPMNDIFKMVGAEAPAFLQGAGTKTQAAIEAEEAFIEKQDMKKDEVLHS